MVKFHKIGMGLLGRNGMEVHSFNGEVEIIKLEGNKLNIDIPDISAPGRVNALTMVLTMAGKANLEIDEKKYTLLPNTLMDLTGLQVFRNFIFSDDYLGYNIMVSSRFYDEIFREEKHLTPEAALRKSANPLDNIRQEDAVLLVEIIEKIIWNISRNSHIWHRRMVMNEIRCFYMEAGNIIVNSLASAEKEQNLHDNDLLFFKFIQLLQDSNNERKTVAFYADKLCLTPDYFAKIIKNYTGRNVTDWINEALLRQAKLYLRDPGMTIQQTADMLNFSDQSAFGNFFKKQTGMSPAQYQKKQ
ncbi:MAG: AraC family transcriptional regulator [Bacteroidales bacterium]|jgi:AraC-like DNA-binding protein|nr:AraC family transcriptional regulator [Bacteroidales bacterium]